MIKKLVLILAIVALVASAGTVPSGPRYKVTLTQTSVVQGTELKAGDYQLSLADSKLTIIADNGKNPVEVAVKVETDNKKFETTMVRFNTATGKAVISEIRLGGTKTRLLFN
jgi:hypothetical protein